MSNKLLVIGLDCAAPDLLFNDEALGNFRRLMDAGCWLHTKWTVTRIPVRIECWD